MTVNCNISTYILYVNQLGNPIWSVLFMRNVMILRKCQNPNPTKTPKEVVMRNKIQQPECPIWSHRRTSKEELQPKKRLWTYYNQLLRTHTPCPHNRCATTSHRENIPIWYWPPLKPHFYIVKLGFTGYTLFFLFLLKNIDCGYSLEAEARRF